MAKFYNFGITMTLAGAGLTKIADIGAERLVNHLQGGI